MRPSKTLFRNYQLLSAILTIQLTAALHAQTQSIQCGSFLTESRISEVATSDKPQSKVWRHAGYWWCVLGNNETFSVYRFDGTDWSKHLDLPAQGAERADCLPVGDDVYILAYAIRTPSLHKIHYNGAQYDLSPGWETPVELSLGSGSESATITRDSSGRLWIGIDASRNIDVYYSNTSERDWSGPITLRENVSSDDICAITSLRDGGIGVMWSDQDRMEFGFAVHRDSDAPELWQLETIRAEGPIADDHINLACASDGTLYAIVKTEFDTDGYPQLGLLQRTPSGEWQELVPFTILSATDTGTRPIILLNEERRELYVFYTNWADNPRTISVKTAQMDDPVFPRESIRLLEDSRSLNNVTSTRQIVSDETGVLILAAPAGGRAVHYCFIRDFNSLHAQSGIDDWRE